MIAQLMCDKEETEWQLSETEDLYKDMVTFVLPGNYKAILISHPKRYEIHLSPIPNRKATHPIECIASNVLKIVCSALNTVIKRLRGQYTTPDLTIYDLGFFCCGKHDNGKQHLMLLDKKLVENKPATCIQDKTKILLKPAHLVWNGSHKFGGKYQVWTGDCKNMIELGSRE